MKKRAFFAMLCLAIALMTGMARADVVISNFEDNSVDGWTTYAGNPVAVVPAPLPGMGTYSMEETVNNAYWGEILIQSGKWGSGPNDWWGNSMVNPTNINANSHLKLDIDFPAANWLPNYATVQLRLQSSGGAVSGDQWFTTNLTGLIKDAITPVDIDYSAFTPMDPGTTSINFILYVQPNYDPNWGTYTAKAVIDNVTLTVPEPATLVLLAMSGLMAILYWRKR
jgi:hypothetical protein